MTKETGIIMSGHHPVDILEGRKTMSRRTRGLGKINQNPDDWYLARISGFRYLFANKNVLLPSVDIKCPYGQVGDRLWVKETWAQNPVSKLIFYKADVDFPEIHTWKPSLFMPRWASRISLEITDIRVERLQEITEEDAIREGCFSDAEITLAGNDYTGLYAADRYYLLWDSLNAKRDYSWTSNPWCWCISFKIAERR